MVKMMVTSLNCLLLENTSFDDDFVINIANVTEFSYIKVEIDNLKISNLKLKKFKENEDNKVVSVKFLKPIHKFNKYFKELNQENIHVIVQLLTAESLTMIMKKILKNVARSSNKSPGFSICCKINLSISCCKAPGIGKTHYGFELFNHLKNNPKDVLVDLRSRQPVSNPDFLSIYLDFGLEVRLNRTPLTIKIGHPVV
ncbi:unnamed protein product [Rhizophagus irregularis]|nr:unnamed protein product [Rhizophagus irregularis]